MRRIMITNNKVQTEVISKGRWIEEDPLPHSSKHIVLIIPGNPGIPQFYEDFIKALDSKLTSDLPVWIIGHAGHVQPPENLEIAMPSNKKWAECYSLVAQLQHKAEFIKKHVPEDAQLHLIGHSIGAWMVINLLKDPDVNRRIKKCYLLFPTIERMAESRNGIIFTTFTLPYSRLLICLSWIFTKLFPLFLQMLLIRIFGIFYGIPVKFNKIITEMLNPKVLHKIIKLAGEEMKYVKEADHETISKHADKLWLYYGANDKWTPVKYYRDMISKHPGLDAQLCQRNFQHTFVLKNSEGMGYIVGDLINENSI